MPAYEYTEAKVTITVEVDGHIITFAETRRVRGCRYHGKKLGPFTSVTTCFENNVRVEAARATTDAMKRAGELTRRMYPLTTDNVEVPA